MKEEKRKEPIIKLGEIIEEPEALQEIGRKLVRQAIENSVEERLGLEMSNPQITQVIHKGEAVPSFLVGEPDLIIEDGFARVGWLKSWCDLWVWNRAYGRAREVMEEPPAIRWDDPRLRPRLKTVLTREELEVVKRLESLK